MRGGKTFHNFLVANMFIFICVGGFAWFVCVCVLCGGSDWGNQKRAFQPLKLELKKVVGHQEAAGSPAEPEPQEMGLD